MWINTVIYAINYSTVKSRLVWFIGCSKYRYSHCCTVLLLLIVFIIGYIIHKNSQKDEPLIRPEQDPPAEIYMHSARRPRSRKYITETNAMHVPLSTMPEIDDKDKVPASAREKTQHSNLRKQIVTPSLVNPVMRDRSYTEVEESGDKDKLPP